MPNNNLEQKAKTPLRYKCAEAGVFAGGIAGLIYWSATKDTEGTNLIRSLVDITTLTTAGAYVGGAVYETLNGYYGKIF